MAGIKQPIQDILARLAAIPVINGDNNQAPLYSNIWNNQVKDMKIKEGAKTYAFPLPAAFLEILTPVKFEAMGLGLRSADLGIRIHLVHEFYNTDGTQELDLTIFDLRDAILATDNGLSFYCPSSCGPMVCVSEEQDYDHSNVYHYILDFACNFTDSKGSAFDSTTPIVPYVDPTPEFIIPVNTF
jgi:hypothetical protein